MKPLEFWDMLTKDNKKKIKEMFQENKDRQVKSDSIPPEIIEAFQSYKKSAEKLGGLAVEGYLKVMAPDAYVEILYKRFRKGKIKYDTL